MKNQREIKFRVWDKVNKKMVSSAISSDKLYMSLAGKLFNGLNGEDFTKDFILMQYTGLKDKKGKEIYEGDIVRATKTYQGTKPSYPIIGEVHWYKWDGWRIWWMPAPDEELEYSLDLGTALSYMEPEVIGNIYENPELLKK